MLAISCALVAGCAGPPAGDAAQAPESETLDPLVEDLDPPPVNFPVEPEPIPRADGRPRLPEGDVSALLVTLGDEPFSGRLEAAGALSVGNDRIRASTERGDLEVLYRLPPELDRRVRAPERGTVAVRELSSPAGADQSLSVTGTDGVLALGQVWTTSPDPLTVEIARDLVIVQGPVRAPDPGYTEVETVVVAAGARTEAVVGKPFVVQAGGGELEVLLESSHFFSAPEDDEGQYPDAYILRAWVVRVG